MKMTKRVVYIHGKGGSPEEAGHYRALFPDADVIGFDYRAQTPWEAEEEFPALYDAAVAGCRSACIIANSIGAFFALCSLGRSKIDRAFLISPIVDMEALILHMMTWANVTEQELREKREIPTDFGETLSWEYLCYTREHPIVWPIPSHILYGEKDHLTSRAAVAAFADKIGGTLTVMKGGEHWFHTDGQMSFLDEWIKTSS